MGAVAEERHLPSDEYIKNHAHASNVYFLVVTVIQYLWRHVIGSPVDPLAFDILVVDHASTEINNFYMQFLVDNNVGGLDVAVNDVLLVDVVEPLQNLLDNLFAVALSQVFLVLDSVKQVLAFDVIEDDVKVLRVDVPLVDLDNIGVVQFFQDVYFGFYGLDFLLGKTFELDEFDDSLLVGGNVQGQFNFAVVSNADGVLVDFVVVRDFPGVVLDEVDGELVDVVHRDFVAAQVFESIMVFEFALILNASHYNYNPFIISGLWLFYFVLNLYKFKKYYCL